VPYAVESTTQVNSWPFPLADPDDPGLPPRPMSGWKRGVSVRRAVARRRHGRRLAVIDTHFPWQLSGFRYHEAEELLRRRPDTLFFSLYRCTDPFPAQVHLLRDFPTIAPVAGVTDVYAVFLNLAAGLLGHSSGAAGVRPDISLRPIFERFKMSVHVTIYPGGGWNPAVDCDLLRQLAGRCSTVFTSVSSLRDLLPNARATEVPVPTDFYGWHERNSEQRPLRLGFVGDDQPRKGLATLLDAYEQLGGGFELVVVGPHERYADRLRTIGAQIHGWLRPDRLRDVLQEVDCVVAPATVGRIEDGYGDVGFADGFPTTAVRVAMLSGCCLIGSNPLADHSLLEPGVHYLEFRERDAGSLAQVLRSLLDQPERRRQVAARGARRIRERCDVRTIVADKLHVMGLIPDGSDAGSAILGHNGITAVTL
jgi:glycosyltransferase involved in cell wall biosynthesis